MFKTQTFYYFITLNWHRAPKVSHSSVPHLGRSNVQPSAQQVEDHHAMQTLLLSHLPLADLSQTDPLHPVQRGYSTDFLFLTLMLTKTAFN